MLTLTRTMINGFMNSRSNTACASGSHSLPLSFDRFGVDRTGEE